MPCALQALSILHGFNVGALVQLTVSKCSPPSGDNASGSDTSATPVNMSSTDSIDAVTGTFKPPDSVVI